MTRVPEKTIFRSVTVHSKNLYSQCNLPAQTEQIQDIYNLFFFNFSSLEVIAIVKKDDTEDKYRYILQKLPGEIIPEECSTKVHFVALSL